MTIKEFIRDVNDGNLSSAKQKFDVLMANKIRDILSAKKVEEAKKFFNKKVS